jgi:hypothetical protein
VAKNSFIDKLNAVELSSNRILSQFHQFSSVSNRTSLCEIHLVPLGSSDLSSLLVYIKRSRINSAFEPACQRFILPGIGNCRSERRRSRPSVSSDSQAAPPSAEPRNLVQGQTEPFDLFDSHPHAGNGLHVMVPCKHIGVVEYVVP